MGVEQSVLATINAGSQRSDYRPFPFNITHTELVINLHPTHTRVVSTLHISPLAESLGPLQLKGEGLQLGRLLLNSQPHSVYEECEDSLLVVVPDDPFILTIETELSPATNSELEGLYLADGVFCTQCEAEGFRKITYFPDRPDVLSTYTVTIHASKNACPILLSNGNQVASGEDVNSGSHWVTWHDPFPKPCYLFALVAGELASVNSSHITTSGKTVSLSLYTLPGQSESGQFGLKALQKAMHWDEQCYGLEYDLAVYHIVATDFFNVEAMENKSLNIFNSEYVLADPQNTSDWDYYQIESVIAHEYFHNWTGNRVTLRDWFQLTLKEGLTVFRDQQFSADTYSPIISRLHAVKKLLFEQFLDDDGPFMHAPRPEQVTAIDNFYTTTVYEKGAEIIRMIWRLTGDAGFKVGLQQFLTKHDGTGATCEDFIEAMQGQCEHALLPMLQWFDSAGRPRLICETQYHPLENYFTLTCTQQDLTHQPLVIPLWIELITPTDDGKYTSEPHQLVMKKSTQSWQFETTGQAPILAMLCDFSAPLECDLALDDAQRVSIILHAKDAVVRWSTLQYWYADLIARLVGEDRDDQTQLSLLKLTGTLQTLCSSCQTPELLAELLMFPAPNWVISRYPGDIHQVSQSIDTLRKIILNACQSTFLSLYHECNGMMKTTEGTPKALLRKLQDELLLWLYPVLDEIQQQQLLAHCLGSKIMSEQLGILNALNQADPEKGLAVLEQIYPTWQASARALNKWFSLQAKITSPDSLARISSLLTHPRFDRSNPNNVKALVGVFIEHNISGFHQTNGEGYQWLTELVLAVDQDNPQLASTLVKPYLHWQMHNPKRQQQMYAELVAISQHVLSDELGEKVQLALNWSH